MAHFVRDKDKLIARVRRMGGQLEAVERALVQEADCADTLQLIASARGAMNGLMAEVLEGHIRGHFATTTRDLDPDGDQAVDQLVEIVRTYLK